jgi:hypothetical protein
MFAGVRLREERARVVVILVRKVGVHEVEQHERVAIRNTAHLFLCEPNDLGGGRATFVDVGREDFSMRNVRER